MRFRSRRRALALPIALLALVAFAPSALAAASPYGTNDAGGFRNVLPPGQSGTASFNQILAFRGPGLLPPHAADQQPLYENLLRQPDPERRPDPQLLQGRDLRGRAR